MHKLYPKEPLENKVFRALVLKEAQKNTSLQKELIKKCEQDILFFVNIFCFTYNPRLAEPHLPFVTYTFQDTFLLSLVEDIEAGKDVAVEKSRDMGFSWMMVVAMLYGFRFRGWSSLYGSYKEDYVDEVGNMDSHFERLRYVLERLPHWMKPDDIISKYMGISSKTLGTAISGDAGVNFGTGGRRKFVVLDEFQLWPSDAKALRKTKDVANCRIIGGTPEGRYNVYGKIMTGEKDYKHLDFHKHTLHWSLHPSKTQEWYEEQKTKRTKLEMAKELDISYEDSVTGKVYPSFSTLAQFGEYEYRPSWPLYTGWDFGRDMTAIVWVQRDPDTGKHYVIDAYQKPDCDIDYFVPFITGKLSDVAHLPFTYSDEEKEMIETHKVWLKSYAYHFGDPYNGKSRNVLSTNTIQKQLAKYNIHLKFNTKSTLENRINTAELTFRSLHVDNRLTEFIQAIEQSKYPDVKDNSQGTAEKTKPIHNIFSHYRTALEYYCDNAKDYTPQKNPLNYVNNKHTVALEKDSAELFGRSDVHPLQITYR